jgi:hypothetical protein
MNQAGRPKFAAFDSLTEQVAESKVIDNNDITHTEESKGIGDKNTDSSSGTDQNKGAKSAKSKGGRIKPKNEIPQDLQEQILELVQGIAQKAAIEKLFGKRSTYKGPRVTRSYKIEIEIDNWLDNINEATTIEKSTIVTEAIREYITAKYPEYKPEKEQISANEG